MIDDTTRQISLVLMALGGPMAAIGTVFTIGACAAADQADVRPTVDEPQPRIATSLRLRTAFFASLAAAGFLALVGGHNLQSELTAHATQTAESACPPDRPDSAVMTTCSAPRY